MEAPEQEEVAGGSAPDRAISVLSAVLFTTPVEISTHPVMLNTVCGHAVKGQDPLQRVEETAEDRERNHVKTVTIRKKTCRLRK